MQESILNEEVTRTDNEISEVEPRLTGEWEVITFKIDSGAVDNVIPKEVGNALPIKETSLSKMGVNYQAANGTPIKNHGQRIIKGFIDDWTPMSISAQVADVNRPFFGISKPYGKGRNMVVFDSRGSYNVNKSSGTITPIKEKHGSYTIDLWVHNAEENQSSRNSTKKQDPRQAPAIKPTVVQNRYQAMQEEEEDENDMEVDETKRISMDFIRRALL